MPLITHVFNSHKRIENGVVVSHDFVPRRANLEYDVTGNKVVISILPTLSPKCARLVKDDGTTLYYKGEDSDYRFEVECWTDNNTIKRLSVFRDDTGVEYQYISDHQDAMSGHVCDNAAMESSNPWKERYDALQKEREDLLAKMEQLSLFATARQKMFSTLKQDGNYKAAMQENVGIIKSEREGKMHPVFKFGLAVVGIGILILGIGGGMNKDSLMGTGGILIGVGIVLVIGGLAVSVEPELVDNQYITNFLRPFIEGHRKDYSNAGVYNDSQNVLKSEIAEPEDISKKISQKIDELTNKIEDINHQMQLMLQMN